LSHDFIKELGFNLKTILPMIAMSTCIPDYKHICFVDTPGYNPSNSGYTNEDFNTATEYLTNSNALIWLVGLDTNGTIPQSDLKFLDQLNLDNKELYIVANKADLKSNSELEEILDQFEEVLDEYGLNYEGISAYDSIKKMEKSFRKQNLQDFLNTVDRDIVSKEKLANELYS
ncbi:dynamin family protein, partial [Brachyspira pulli]|uniref:dynamin family protein n=1 Tax=Brachyspira pulli TaxID=310721 RepID=UPI003003DD45